MRSDGPPVVDPVIDVIVGATPDVNISKSNSFEIPSQFHTAIL